MPAKKPTIKDLQRQLSIANDALEASLAVSPEIDNTFFPAGMSGAYTDRNAWDRKKIFSESLRAWRVNPIARRIVRLIRSFVLGKGLTITSDDTGTNKFLQEWFNHPLNKFKKNVKRWLDENTRTGNLFFLYTVQANGMTHIRAVPAEQIEEIISKDNDIEQETRYNKDQTGAEFYEAYDPMAEQDSFMLHFASNQPVGSAWGEGDLPPVLVWVGRFSTWLEDRVRLNHFRAVFMYIVMGNYKNEEEKENRRRAINANPPKSGSVLVTDASEQWGIISAKLDSFDASVDGMAIKKMVAAGVGLPLHYFAEPEGSTQTTAEAAGTPTFRTLEETQDELYDMLKEMAEVAVQVRSRIDKSVKVGSVISIHGPDITERDNATLALALGRSYPHLADLFDRDGIDSAEFMRLVYKQFAEVWKDPTPNIKKKPLVKTSDGIPAIPTDPQTDPTDTPAEESNP
jgi:hypothetical protein